MNTDILNVMHERDALLNQVKSDPSKLSQYRLARNKVVHMIEKSKREYFLQELEIKG